MNHEHYCKRCTGCYTVVDECPCKGVQKTTLKVLCPACALKKVEQIKSKDDLESVLLQATGSKEGTDPKTIRMGFPPALMFIKMGMMLQIEGRSGYVYLDQKRKCVAQKANGCDVPFVPGQEEMLAENWMLYQGEKE